jgi:hypothetical protein
MQGCCFESFTNNLRQIHLQGSHSGGESAIGMAKNEARQGSLKAGYRHQMQSKSDQGKTKL